MYYLDRGTIRQFAGVSAPETEQTERNSEGLRVGARGCGASDMDQGQGQSRITRV